MEAKNLTQEQISQLESKNLTEEQISQIDDSLKRCSKETCEAAVAFRASDDASKIPAVVLGIIEKYVEPENKELLKNPADDMVLAEALNLDSISMLEISLDVGNVIGIEISNEELQAMRTYGDVKDFIAKKTGEK